MSSFSICVGELFRFGRVAGRLGRFERGEQFGLFAEGRCMREIAGQPLRGVVGHAADLAEHIVAAPQASGLATSVLRRTVTVRPPERTGVRGCGFMGRMGRRGMGGGLWF